MAMRAASISAAVPSFFLHINIAVAAAKDAEECPEGKEKSCIDWNIPYKFSNWFPTTKFCPLTQKARGLAHRCFIIPLQNISDRMRAIAIDSPTFLYFLGSISSMATANIIQNIPPFPRVVIAYIIGLVIGL